jgi:hypothetical protein
VIAGTFLRTYLACCLCSVVEASRAQTSSRMTLPFTVIGPAFNLSSTVPSEMNTRLHISIPLVVLSKSRVERGGALRHHPSILGGAHTEHDRLSGSPDISKSMCLLRGI